MRIGRSRRLMRMWKGARTKTKSEASKKLPSWRKVRDDLFQRVVSDDELLARRENQFVKIPYIFH